MDNVDLQTNKDYDNDQPQRSKIVIATVHTCLCEDHNQCNGIYSDSISGRYIVKCSCPCHTTTVDMSVE
jgi:hypothetical protein